MASDGTSKPESLNPCCVELKAKFLDVEEKRQALRKAVKLLERQVGMLESENAQLKKAYQEECMGTMLAKDAKEKEIAVRINLEKENNDLKKQLSVYEERDSLRNMDNKKMLSRISEQELEIKRLEMLLREEKNRFTEKKTEMEKKAAMQRKLSKTEDDRKHAEIERKKAEELRLSLDRLKAEFIETANKLNSEKSKVHDFGISIKKEKKKTAMEKKRADSESAKAEEKSRLLEVEQQRAMDEKTRADDLNQKLEEEKHKRAELEKKVTNMIHAQVKPVNHMCNIDRKHKSSASVDAGSLKLLREQLKLEKKRGKYFKRKAKLEKVEKNCISQNFKCLKQDFMKLSNHLRMLGDQLSQSIQGTSGLSKIEESPHHIRLNLHDMDLCHISSKLDSLFARSCNCSGSAQECICFDNYGVNRVRQLSGTKSELESAANGSLRNKLQNSAVCSASTMLFDKKFIDPRGKDAAAKVTSSEMPSLLKQRSTVMKVADEVAVGVQSEMINVGPDKTCRSDNPKLKCNECPEAHFQQTLKIMDKENDGSRNHAIHDQLQSATSFFHKYDQIYLDKAERHLEQRNQSIKGGNCIVKYSQTCDLSDPMEDRRGTYIETQEDMSKRYQMRYSDGDEQQKSDIQKCIHNKNVVPDTCMPPCSQLRTSSAEKESNEDHYRSKKEIVSIINDEYIKLNCVRNIALGDCMKLLELDNSDDERLFMEAIERPLSPSLPRITEKHKYLSSSEEFDKMSGRHTGLKKNSEHIVVFSNAKNEDSISRIIQATRRFILGYSVKSQNHCIFVDILHALASEVNLQLEEKCCTLFSLLICYISGAISSDSGSVIFGNILSFSKSFAMEIVKGISDESNRSLFLDVCQVDILLNLMEDFLIMRKILVYSDMQSGQSCALALPEGSYCLKVENMFVSKVAADVDKLVAASIALASFSAALDQIDFLVGTSYKILRMCKNDVSCNLFVLHVFEFICEEKLLSLEEYSCSLASIKSVVSYLERGQEHLISPSVQSINDASICFTPCVHCPFTKNGIDIERFASSLMDKLEQLSLAARKPFESNTVMLSMAEVSKNVHLANESGFHANEFSAGDTACGKPCLLYKCNSNGADLSDCIPGNTFCYFADAISTIELLGCYMSWQWLFDNILQRLVKMLESCPSGEYSAAIVVLIGHLGRFGVDFGGFQLTGIIELQSSLLKFIETCIKNKSSFAEQIAAVGALISLVPLNFIDIVEHQLEDKQYCQMKPVKEWFSHLHRKQQILALRFFEADVIAYEPC